MPPRGGEQAVKTFPRVAQQRRNKTSVYFVKHNLETTKVYLCAPTTYAKQYKQQSDSKIYITSSMKAITM